MLFLQRHSFAGVIRIIDMKAGKELYSQTNSLVSKATEKGGLAITQLIYNSFKNSFAVITADHNIIFHKADNFECIKQVGFISIQVIFQIYILNILNFLLIGI